MKVREIREHFLSRADWVDRNNTVDRVIVGDPDADVDHCIVTWIPSFAALRTVVERGVELLICHEPTFWDHGNDSPDNGMDCTEKLSFIKKHNLTILRNHDMWDWFPEFGIPWSWARFLGLGTTPAALGEHNCHHRYDIPPVPFGEFARRIAARTGRIGEPLIEVVGDPDRPVSKIGIGTGCGSDIFTYLNLGCDCCISCDDGRNYWRCIQYAADRDVPVICVNHATSEEPGMISMTKYINEHIDGLTAEHLPQGCRFRLVGA